MEEDKAHMERSSIHKTDKENARTKEARGLGVLYLMRAVSTHYRQFNLIPSARASTLGSP